MRDDATGILVSEPRVDGLEQACPIGQPVELRRRNEHAGGLPVLRDDDGLPRIGNALQPIRRLGLEVTDGHDVFRDTDGTHDLPRTEYRPFVVCPPAGSIMVGGRGPRAAEGPRNVGV